MEKTQLLLMTAELERLEQVTDRFRKENEGRCEELQFTVKELKQDNEMLKDENTQLRNRVFALREQLEKCGQTCEERATIIQELKENLNSTIAQLQAAQSHSTHLETRLSTTELALTELQKQAQSAVSQTTSYEETVRKYEALLETAVNTNKLLEQEHQTCLDELQTVSERSQQLEEVLTQQRAEFERRGKELRAEIDRLIQGKLEAEGAVKVSESDVKQYIVRKRRLLSLRAQTLAEFFTSLDQSM